MPLLNIDKSVSSPSHRRWNSSSRPKKVKYIFHLLLVCCFSCPILKPQSNYCHCFFLFFFAWKSVDPDFYSKNLLMLGKTYLAMKDKDKALMWLAKAKAYPGRTHEDKEVQQPPKCLQSNAAPTSMLTAHLSLPTGAKRSRRPLEEVGMKLQGERLLFRLDGWSSALITAQGLQSRTQTQKDSSPTA